MIARTPFPLRQVAFGFAGGALAMGLVSLVGTAIAQTPPPAVIDMQQMLELCRQMMSQAGGMMQGMMSGMCMGR